MSIFKRLFGSKRQAEPVQPVPQTPIEEMNLAEIVVRLRALEDSVPAKSLIPVYQRLFEIGMFEHGLTDEERSVACKLADGVKADILTALEDEPVSLEAFIEAADNHADKVQFYGYGSLQWIMDEHDIGADKLVQFACMPEVEGLLPTFLTMLPDDVMTEVRGEFLRTLIRTRRESEDQSDVRSLHALLTKPDRSAEILLKSDEAKVVRNMPSDYEAAERLVASIMNSNS